MTRSIKGTDVRRVQRLLASLGIALLVAVVCLSATGLPGAPLVRALQRQEADALFRLEAAPAVERARARDVEIVAIDDRSQDELGAWETWPRSYYAAVIDELTAAGARAIALDVVLGGQAPDDDVLASALRRSGRVVAPVVSAPSGLLPTTRQGYPSYRRATLPPPLLADAASTLAETQVEPSDDGVARSVTLAAWMGGSLYPSMPLAIVSTYLRRPGPLDLALRGGVLPFAGRDIPVDDRGGMLVHYVGAPSSSSSPSSASFKVTSFADLLRGRADAAGFRDRVVFLGVLGSTGVADQVWTPTSTAETGPMDIVEVHANAVATILAGGLPSRQAVFLHDQDMAGVAVIVVALSLLAAVAVAILPPWQAGVVALVLLLGYNAVMARLWWVEGIVPDLLAPTIAIAGTIALGAAYRVAFDEREQRRTRQMMARYVSPDVMEAVLADPSKLALGGERREMTILFSDIREFTALSERLDPRTLVSLLTDYLDAMSGALMRREGVLDKFIGDQVMGFWGAPVARENHAILACEAALDMLAALAELNRGWTARGLPSLTVGIGVNTGVVSVGNFGSASRFDYTVIGDPVNTCSRLQELNKDYGTSILITEQTRHAVGRAFATRFIDDVAIRGKAEPLVMYELLARASGGEQAAFLAAWDEAMRLFREGAIAEASVAFRRILQARPDDGPARAYLARCAKRQGGAAGDCVGVGVDVPALVSAPDHL